MARAGLGVDWSCLFANDFDHKKGESYKANWGDNEILIDDIHNVCLDNLPGQADLAWASFPCQDLSVAGGGAGLFGKRSGTVFAFLNVIRDLIADGRPPKLIALENVIGTLTSHNGADFEVICQNLVELEYRFGAVIVDASLFLPQSRPRLFVIAVHSSVEIPSTLTQPTPAAAWHTKALCRAYEALGDDLRTKWLWWTLPSKPVRQVSLCEVIEDNPTSVKWHTTAETTAVLSMMSEVNLAKVEIARQRKTKMVGTIFKRTRCENGIKVQRAEIRFDGLAGCLRTPSGGSSRQLIMVVEEDKIRSRLMSSRETARLMGLPEAYMLPERYNQAYHLTGDGVAVPVVRFIANSILEPCLLRCS